jgi:hypothetical protein
VVLHTVRVVRRENGHKPVVEGVGRRIGIANRALSWVVLVLVVVLVIEICSTENEDEDEICGGNVTPPDGGLFPPPAR